MRSSLLLSVEGLSLLVGCFASMACATEVTGFGEDDDGSGGAQLGGAGGAEVGGAGPTGGSGATNVGGAGATGGDGSGGSSSMCDPPEHQCGGICVGNTPATGCFQSDDCVPCAAPPANGVAACSDTGECDFTCNAGYMKNGSVCQCQQQCCTNADCGGGGAVCTGGVCETPPTCSDGGCFTSCIVTGNLGGGCINDMCVCIPAP